MNQLIVYCDRSAVSGLGGGDYVWQGKCQEIGQGANQKGSSGIKLKIILAYVYEREGKGDICSA